MIGTHIKNYEITGKLGAGGMGEVYLATDTRLDRRVALKFLPQEFASDPDRRRRLAIEAKTASSLDHPNILTIYEVDSYEGRPFIAMAYVDGVTLKEKMQQGRLPLEEAVRYAVQIASGLGAAHAGGIVHRDVKPDNILIDQNDRARLTDFGLARLKESSGLTGRGTTVGTVGYMSPEQAQGMEVDARSDVFSLGVVLYELLAGKRPFVAEHAAAALYSIVHEKPQPIREANPEVPEKLGLVVERALAKSPSERYADARALERDLRAVARELEFSRISSGSIVVQRPARRRRLAWGLAGILIIWLGSVLAFFPDLFHPKPSEVEAVENTLAVMYFENLSDPQDQSRLGDIITELLTTDLSGSEFLKVISTQRLHDLLKQEGFSPDRKIDRSIASKIAQRAGASRMLVGTLSNLGGRTILTAQLVDVASGEVVGSDRVDGIDVFTVVDDLSASIKRIIGLTEPQILAGDMPVAEATTTSAEAYREYLQGMDNYHALDWQDAHIHFDRALSLDSTFALAYIRKAVAYFSDGQKEKGLVMFAAAARNIDKVTGCDRLLIEAFAIDLGQHWDSEGAMRTLKRATVQCPTNKEPFFWIANFMSESEKQRDSAIYYARKALELDPDYPFALLTLANLLLAKEDYSAARSVIERYRNVRSKDVIPYGLLVEYAVGRHQLDSALVFSRQALQVARDHRLGYGSFAQVYALMGQPDSAIAWYERMMKADDNPFTQIGGFRQIGEVHKSWGRFARALEYYSRAGAVAEKAGLRDQESANQVFMGGLYRDTERLDDALRHYRKAEEFDSLSERGRLHIARTYARLGQPEKALEVVDKYRSEWAGRVDSTDLLADRYEIVALNNLAAGEYQKAIDNFLLCRKVGNDSTVYSLPLAEAYLQAGQSAAAISELSTFRKHAERQWPTGYYLKTLYLLAKANVAAGHPEDAIEPLQRFLVFWGDADWKTPMIDDAKNLYGQIVAQ